jgi:hypothetical protein
VASGFACVASFIFCISRQISNKKIKKVTFPSEKDGFSSSIRNASEE